MRSLSINLTWFMQLLLQSQNTFSVQIKELMKIHFVQVLCGYVLLHVWGKIRTLKHTLLYCLAISPFSHWLIFFFYQQMAKWSNLSEFLHFKYLYLYPDHPKHTEYWNLKWIQEIKDIVKQCRGGRSHLSGGCGKCAFCRAVCSLVVCDPNFLLLMWYREDTPLGMNHILLW